MKGLKGWTQCLVIMIGFIACTVQPAQPLVDTTRFTQQKVGWHACDSTILGYDASGAFLTLGDRVRCASILVPLNWNEPWRGEISLALIRTSAERPERRSGSIFFNPGGPGQDGLIFAVLNGVAWSNANTKTVLGRNFKRLSDEYDLIGFSPRGVGASTRLYCGSNEVQSRIRVADRSAANIEAMLRNGRLLAEACLKNPLATQVDTEATVQDLELIRHLLAEPVLNFVGYSYGSWLGAWYAKRFPASTGRMFLDGIMPFQSDFQSALQAQPQGFEHTFREAIVPYLARHDGLLGLGKTTAQVNAVFDNLHEPLRSVVAASISSLMYNRSNLPAIAVGLAAGRALDGLIRAKSPFNADALLVSINEQRFSSDTDFNGAVHDAAIQLLGLYKATLNPQARPTELTNAGAVFTAVFCNDSVWNQDPNFWISLDDRQAVSFPLAGGYTAENPCIHWSRHGIGKPATPLDMPPMLLLQNEYDPATPLAGALAALEATPNARMLVIEDEVQHTAFPYGTDCVDLTVTQYLLDGTLPAKSLSTCPSLPLPGELERHPVGVQGASGSVRQARQAIPTNSFLRSGTAALAAIARMTQEPQGFAGLFRPGRLHPRDFTLR